MGRLRSAGAEGQVVPPGTGCDPGRTRGGGRPPSQGRRHAEEDHEQRGRDEGETLGERPPTGATIRDFPRWRGFVSQAGAPPARELERYCRHARLGVRRRPILRRRDDAVLQEVRPQPPAVLKDAVAVRTRECNRRLDVALVLGIVHATRVPSRVSLQARAIRKHDAAVRALERHMRPLHRAATLGSLDLIMSHLGGAACTGRGGGMRPPRPVRFHVRS